MSSQTFEQKKLNMCLKLFWTSSSKLFKFQTSLRRFMLQVQSQWEPIEVKERVWLKKHGQLGTHACFQHHTSTVHGH